MNSHNKKSTCALVVLLAFANLAHADWAQSTDPAVVTPTPVGLQVQAQNPPSFAWARHASKPPSYVLEVYSGSTLVNSFTTTDRNFYLPDKPFNPGSYTWRVRPSTSTTDWSTPRAFVIDGTSKVFTVPQSTAMKSTVLAKAHPRMLPANYTKAANWSVAQQTQWGGALSRLAAEVQSKTTSAIDAKDSMWTVAPTAIVTAALATQNTDIRRTIGAITRQLEASSLLYKLTGDARYLTEAIRRGDNLVALDPNGPSSYAWQDQATRQICLALAKAVDLLWADLDSTRRAAWMNNINVRTNVFYLDLAGSDGRMDQYPYDSHGGNTLGYLALISTLTLGEIPAAQTWFDFSARSYINTIYAWSGPEGGFSNGGAYAQYTADMAIQLWQPFGQATGIDLFSKPWSRGFARYFEYFFPPGAPTHLFGDQHEYPPVPTLMKAFVARVNTPDAAWYVKNTVGDEDAMTMLLATFPLPATTVAAAPPPNAALFPSIGWVAMHSDISDRNRTSLFFKSSPYGSYNHSHGDQNAIVLNAGSRKLLIESGYEDFYYSPLVQSWYRQTKATNAVTFDGGIGQITTANNANLGYNGKITAFSTTPALDFAEGDATPAYGSAVSKAVRKVWYLRGQDAAVIMDTMASPVAHTFEWNFHSNPPMTQLSPTKVKIVNVDRSVCVSSLSNDATRFETRVGAPPAAGTTEYHGAFTKGAAGTSQEFLILLDVGCKSPSVSLTTTSTGRTLTVGGQSITLPK